MCHAEVGERAKVHIQDKQVTMIAISVSFVLGFLVGVIVTLVVVAHINRERERIRRLYGKFPIEHEEVGH